MRKEGGYTPAFPITHEMIRKSEGGGTLPLTKLVENRHPSFHIGHTRGSYDWHDSRKQESGYPNWCRYQCGVWRQDIQGQRRIVGKPQDRGRCHARSMGQGSLSGLEVLPGQEETVAGSGSQSCPLGAGSSGG